jgi:hypothetical protein
MIPGTDIEKPEVELMGHDSHAMAIVGTVSRALKNAGAPRAVCDEYRSKALSGDHTHVLAVSMEYVEVS